MAAHPAPKRPDSIRRHNIAVMLSHVHRDGALTRAQLTQRLGLSRSTVGALVADLTGLGVLQEVVPDRGVGVGRPSHTVAPHPQGPFVIAADVEVARLTVAAVGIGGTMLARSYIDTGELDVSPPAVARLIAGTLTRLRSEVSADSRLMGVGISVPGTVDHRTGKVGVAPNLGWRDTHLGSLVSRELDGVPVVVGNDADLAVLAEHQRGEARDSEDVIFLLGRTGVGAGIMTGGLPLHGRDGNAGEIGHVVVDASGPECHCGKRGCAETYVGRGALLRLTRTRGPETEATVRGVLDGAARGEPDALCAVRTVAEALGQAIGGLLNTLNPQRVVLGGSFSVIFELARPELESALRRYALDAPRRAVTLSTPTLGDDSSLIGAAEVAFTELLADPVGAASLSIAPLT